MNNPIRDARSPHYIGDLLYHARTSKDLTVKDVCTMCLVSKPVYEAYEMNRVPNIGFREAEALATLLDLSLDDLVRPFD
ncbi:hypothetical protein [Marinococcus halotolerans]|uniref:hypothetical protein n=1 Tax=Marinococcus halotolerans TaxID=301092 RepID=UPI0003B7388B|nr:hypothetical protein [Marinococcus halotolerans]